MFQNDYEITSESKFWKQNVQFWYLHHPALSNNLNCLPEHARHDQSEHGFAGYPLTRKYLKTALNIDLNINKISNHGKTTIIKSKLNTMKYGWPDCLSYTLA